MITYVNLNGLRLSGVSEKSSFILKVLVTKMCKSTFWKKKVFSVQVLSN